MFTAQCYLLTWCVKSVRQTTRTARLQEAAMFHGSNVPDADEFQHFAAIISASKLE